MFGMTELRTPLPASSLVVRTVAGRRLRMTINAGLCPLAQAQQIARLACAILHAKATGDRTATALVGSQWQAVRVTDETVDIARLALTDERVAEAADHLQVCAGWRELTTSQTLEYRFWPTVKCKSSAIRFAFTSSQLAGPL